MTPPEVPAQTYTLGTEPRTHVAPCMAFGIHMQAAAVPAQTGEGSLVDTNVNTDAHGAGVEGWARVLPYRSGPWVTTTYTTDSERPQPEVPPGTREE